MKQAAHTQDRARLLTEYRQLVGSLTPEETLRLWAEKGITEETLCRWYSRFIVWYKREQQQPSGNKAESQREQLLQAIRGEEFTSSEEPPFEEYIITLWATAVVWFKEYDFEEFFT